WFAGLPRDWIIKVSPNGWINNNLALAWLEYFDTHANPVGLYRLLIIRTLPAKMSKGGIAVAVAPAPCTRVTHSRSPS
ncbi:hypothetical protein K458DRAFT_288535, partial [Lentithecium fluviatile CBS 122367]